MDRTTIIVISILILMAIDWSDIQFCQSHAGEWQLCTGTAGDNSEYKAVGSHKPFQACKVFCNEGAMVLNTVVIMPSLDHKNESIYIPACRRLVAGQLEEVSFNNYTNITYLELSLNGKGYCHVYVK